MKKWLNDLLAANGKVSSKRLAGLIGLVSGIIMIAAGIQNSAIDTLIIGGYGLLGTTIFQKYNYAPPVE